jgi:hypothetical protein
MTGSWRGVECDLDLLIAEMRGSVVGCVVSHGDGAPIPAATIEVIEGPSHEIAAVTNGAGTFILEELLPGDWLLAASAGDRKGYSPKIRIFDDAATAVTIELPDSRGRAPGRPRRKGRGSMPVTIHGRVRSEESDQPIADATVVVDAGPGPAPDIAAVTDRLGAFSFHGLAPGQWLVVAVTPDGKRGETWVDASGAETAEASITIG